MLKLKPLFFSDLCKVEGLRFSIRYQRRFIQIIFLADFIAHLMSMFLMDYQDIDDVISE